MIDRKARERMASALKSYINEEITAFDLDDALYEIMDDTKDETVDYIGSDLWCYYDDNKDHKIVATKEIWNYFYRLLLLLESDAEIEIKKNKWHWHLRQAIAAACLVGFGLVVWKFGFGKHLWIFAMPFGLVSMAISWWATREQIKRQEPAIPITPFPSVASLLAVRRRVPGFLKHPYPFSIADRKIRDHFSEFTFLLKFRMTWLMFAPLPLLFQIFPKRENSTSIKIPGQAA